MKFVSLVFALALAACAAVTPQTPQQTIYQASSAYASAAQVVIAYKALPPCAATSTVLCQRPDVVARLKAADNVAYESLKAAENVARTPGAGANLDTALVAANQAISALTAITSTLQVK